MDSMQERWLSESIHIPSRTVYLTGDVDDIMLELVAKALHLFRGRSINFILNSEGGEETAGLGICDLLLAYPQTIRMTVVGSAQSMAAVILQAADVRSITPSSYLMLHQGEDAVEGHKKNIRAAMRITDMQDDICDEIVLRRIREKKPKYSWAKFREETKFDVYFTAEQALSWGLVDEII